MDEELRKLSVFVSYASEDKTQVLELARKLQSDGMDIWIDRKKLQGGQLWEQEIQKAIASADVSIICLSRQAVSKTGFFQQEIKILSERAREHPEENIFLIPVLLEKCDAPGALNALQWIDYYEKDGYKRLVECLRARAVELGRLLSTEQQELINKMRVEIAQKRAAAAENLSRDVTGSYIVLGTNDNGSDYHGKATISKEEDTYFMKWVIGKDEFEAKGGLLGTVLAVHSSFTVVYDVKPDGTLFGKWGNDGAETLIPVPGQAFFDDLSGSYIASGQGTDGSDYNSKVTVSKDGDSYFVKWFIVGAEYQAKGSLAGNIFMVNGDFSATYEVKPDGSLLARWTNGGFETLTPAPPGF
ncbi:MAG TPA: toll/interleukin-1 receptor domain-containing protein [Pyrinomonadaceae bacterium]